MVAPIWHFGPSRAIPENAQASPAARKIIASGTLFCIRGKPLSQREGREETAFCDTSHETGN
jgi:hypothetical protein